MGPSKFAFVFPFACWFFNFFLFLKKKSLPYLAKFANPSI